MEMGATVKTLTVGEPKNHAITAVQEAIDAADEVIFFARIGDQGRFQVAISWPTSSNELCIERWHACKRVWST